MLVTPLNLDTVSQSLKSLTLTFAVTHRDFVASRYREGEKGAAGAPASAFSPSSIHAKARLWPKEVVSEITF